MPRCYFNGTELHRLVRVSLMSYRMSFTSASLLVQESISLAEVYQSLHNWKSVQQEAFNKNLLQARKPTSAKRNIREICGRLQLLSEDQFALLIEGSRSDQICMLWIAVCKRYEFIKEFAREVIREKYLKLDFLISHDDYDVFFNSKAEWDDGLDSLSETTVKKLRQVTFRLLHETEILSSANMINPATLSQEAVKVVLSDDPSLLEVFPVSDIDIQEWVQ